MAQKSFYKKCFNKWKSGIIDSPLLEICKTITRNEDFIKHHQQFYAIKNAKVFENAFQRMTDELFKYGVKLEYVMVLLAFCLSLDKKMTQQCKWYNTDLLINNLHNVLLKVNFDPINLQQRTKVNSSDCYKFLTIVPILFFCYYL